MTRSRLPSREAPLRGRQIGHSVRSAVAADEPSVFERRWTEFLRFCQKREHSRWVFRGVASETYDCTPSIGRYRTYGADHERELLEVFKREARAHVTGPVLSDWDWLTLAQHHGVPTRLLDWTRNPLIACYFAVASHPFQDTAVIYAVPMEGRQIMPPGHTSSPFEITDVVFVLPSALAPRITTQKGIFSAHPNPSSAWMPDSLRDNSFTISASMRSAFRRRLFQFGVDPAFIYPNLDGLGQSLRWQYESGIGLAVVTL